MRNTDGQSVWLYSLTHDTGEMTYEKAVQGFIKYYVLHGMTMQNVEHDILFHTDGGDVGCGYAMQTLKSALVWFADREESRTLTEVQMIVDATREGAQVQIAYYDDEIDDNPYISRAHW